MADPPARWGHSAVILDGRVYVWGGCTAETPSECFNDSQTKRNLLRKMFICVVTDSRWIETDTEGTPPPSLRGSGCTTNKRNRIFNFGGYCGHQYHWYNDLHELEIRPETSSLEWHCIQPLSDDSSLPRQKQDCGMVYFNTSNGSEECGGQLCVFGGAGLLKGHRKKWSVCDELHVFDILTKTWQVPVVTGSQPPPLSGFSLTAINDHQAVLFGGRGSDNSLLADIYRLTAGKWIWEKIPSTLCSPEILPVPRESHSSVYLNNMLVIIGGLDDKDNSISDCWSFDLSSFAWKKVTIPNEISHVISAIAVCEMIDGDYHLVTYGGLKNLLNRRKPHREQEMNTTTIVSIIDGDTAAVKCWYDFSPMGRQVRKLFKDLKKLEVENKKLKTASPNQVYHLQKQVSEPIQLHSENYKSADMEWISRVDDTLLGIEDLNMILKSLTDVTDWTSLGLSLGLYKPTLESIAGSCSLVKECKTEMISSWLRRSDNVSQNGLPSWKVLVQSLVSQNRSLALKIASDHYYKCDRAFSIS